MVTRFKSPYTQSVTESEVFKRVTNQEKPIDELIDTVKELKSFGQSAIDTNIQTLQDENVFEIQKTKSYLENLNNFSQIEDNINNNFGGNVELWAEDYVAKEYEKKVFSEFGLQDIANNKIDIQPSEAFGEIGKERVKELVNNYNNVKNSIDELGIDFSGGVDATNAFVDEQYKTAINNLTNQNQFKVFKGLGSLFRGQGFNYTSAQDLKKQYNDNIAKTNLSLVSEVNDKFKLLYAISPSIAKEYRNAVKDADVKENIEVTRTEIKSGERLNENGEKETYDFFNIITTYTDRDGETKTKVEGPFEFNEQTPPEIIDMNMHTLNLYKYTEAGRKQYITLANDGVSPKEADRQIPLELRKSPDELRLDDFMQTQFNSIQAAYRDTYYATNPLGETVQRNPNEEIPSMRQYAASILGVTVASVNPNNISGNVILVDSNMNAQTKEYLTTEEGEKDIIQIQDKLLPENIRDNVIADYKNGVVSDEYNSDGMYFGNPAQPIVLRDKEDLEKFGLTTPHQVGVDLNTLKPAFKPYTENISEEPIAVVSEPEEKKILSDNEILEKYKISQEILDELRAKFEKGSYKLRVPKIGTNKNLVTPIEIVSSNISFDTLVELGFAKEREIISEKRQDTSNPLGPKPFFSDIGYKRLLESLYSDLGLL